MLRLTLSGGFSAAGADGIDIAIKSKKARALLAYLALSPRLSRSREEIMALGDAQVLQFFPEAGQAQVLRRWFHEGRHDAFTMTTAGSDQLRPPSQSPLPNLVLAGDFVPEEFLDELTGRPGWARPCGTRGLRTGSERPWSRRRSSVPARRPEQARKRTGERAGQRLRPGCMQRRVSSKPPEKGNAA